MSSTITHAHSKVRQRLVLMVLALTGAVGIALIAAPAAFATEAPVVQLRANRSGINWGDVVKLTGTVTSRSGTPLSGVTVTLQDYSGGKWVNSQSTRLQDGKAVFYKIPRRSRAYRLSFPGYKQFSKSYSSGAGVSIENIGQAIVAKAKQYNGRPYVWGAGGPNSFDCSGFTRYIYSFFWAYLPRIADAQQRAGRAIPRSQMRPGDLLIFTSGGYGYHAGIYAGNGKMWDAGGNRVAYRSIWSNSYVVRRVTF